MNDFQTQISRLVDQFVSQVTIVARETAMQTLQAALGAANEVAARRRPPAATASSSRPASLPAIAPTTAITPTSTRDFIERNPGRRVEQINLQLGTTTREVALPLRKLIAEGVLRSEGEKRSMQYFSAEPSRAPSPFAPAAAPMRRRRA